MPTLSSACVDAVSRERRYLGNTSGFSAEQTRAFIASLSDGGGIQIVVVADAKIVGWCDVTPVPFEGMRHVAAWAWVCCRLFVARVLGRRLVREHLARSLPKPYSASNWRYLLQTKSLLDFTSERDL